SGNRSRTGFAPGEINTDIKSETHFIDHLSPTHASPVANPTAEARSMTKDCDGKRRIFRLTKELISRSLVSDIG
ncbi:MAG: hypothetical protein K1V89_03880, partial [Muribaculaceae bacterium]